MTLRELSKLYYLRKLIERDTARLAKLRALLESGVSGISDMPRGSSARDKLGETMPLILDLQERISRERLKYLREQKKIEEYISGIEDCQIRLIFSRRFVDLMSWRQIAFTVGGGNTEDSVKKACYRHLKKK